MKKIILLICLSLVFSQELKVEGDLNVTGEIDANNQVIKNVGTPQLATDAVNLATAQGLAGMKPERIYQVKNLPIQKIIEHTTKNAYKLFDRLK